MRTVSPVKRGAKYLLEGHSKDNKLRLINLNGERIASNFAKR